MAALTFPTNVNGLTTENLRITVNSMPAKKKPGPKPKPKAKETRGRPTKYNASWAPKMALIMASAGMIDKDMAEAMGVHKSTFDKWKNDHPEFKKVLTKGKKLPNQMVEAALLSRALGYEHPEDKIFQFEGSPVTMPTIKHYPPDTMACMYWLNNRCRDDGDDWIWAQKQEILTTFDNSAKELADAISKI